MCSTQKDKLLDIDYSLFKELLLELDVIGHLLEVNEISFNSEDKVLIEFYKINREKILQKLKTGDY